MGIKPKAVMALDQGTTSSRAMVFAHDGTILGAAQEGFPQHYPNPGWVEHDAEDIWRTQLACARAALETSGLAAADLAGIGVTNQRETVLLWDAENGTPLGNAIVWQCRRTAERCDELKAAGYEPVITARTGLRLDPYFSATKMEWLLAHREGAETLLAQDRLRAGTIDSFLVWRLTGGSSHVTDFSNASRTMLLDLEKLEWADDLLEVFQVPRSILPRLCPSSGVIGTAAPEILGAPVPIAGIAGDQQAALFGQGAFRPGDCKNTYGTGCFVLMNTGERPSTPGHGLVSTVGWVLGPEATGAGSGPRSGDAVADGVTYALEGSIFMGGGVYFVPALTGLGAPYWDPYARGLLVGLTRGTRPEHLARATEEAICFQVRAVLEAMRQTSAVEIAGLRADGGAAGDEFLLQLQADLLGIPVGRTRLRETTALGAAALAGLATGFWTRDEIVDLAGVDRLFTPAMATAERDHLYAEWQRAVERARGWAG
jgi:glycerol kinase